MKTISYIFFTYTKTANSEAVHACQLIWIRAFNPCQRDPHARRLSGDDILP
jgi:hypothetical protein